MKNPKVEIEVSPWMQKLARSPLALLMPICGGVACSFAPQILYQAGACGAQWHHPLVLFCFFAVYLVTWVGALFGARVVWALRK